MIWKRHGVITIFGRFDRTWKIGENRSQYISCIPRLTDNREWICYGTWLLYYYAIDLGTSKKRCTNYARPKTNLISVSAASQQSQYNVRNISSDFRSSLLLNDFFAIFIASTKALHIQERSSCQSTFYIFLFHAFFVCLLLLFFVVVLFFSFLDFENRRKY